MSAEAIKYKKKKKLGSYPYVSVIMTITLALFVIGLFGMVLSYSKSLSRLILENIEVQAYLDHQVTENERIRIHKTLSTKPYILKKNNEEAQLTFISKEEAAKRFIEETGEDFLSFLGDNPLRDAYTIKINPEYQTEAELAKIQADLVAITGVFEVVYSQNLISTINKNITKISLILLGVSAILILIVVIMINNTIKLALFSQRFLIRSMQLVGATSGFIRRPFLARSILYGFIAGALASAALFGLKEYANTKVEELELLNNQQELLFLALSLIVGGMIIGWICTLAAMRKYMKLSLDELY